MNAFQRLLSIVNATLFFWIGRHNKVYVNDHKDCVEVADDADGNAIELIGETGMDSTKIRAKNPSSSSAIDDSRKWEIY